MEDWGPACCGSGCAVCVLDNLDEGNQLEKRDKADQDDADDVTALCCGTGCTVCVLDLGASAGCGERTVSEELLAAFEGALTEARRPLRAEQERRLPLSNQGE